MELIKLSNELTLSIDPPLKESKFVSARFEEGLGGKMPVGELTLKIDKDSEYFDIKDFKIKIIQHDGVELKIDKVSVYDTKFDQINFTLYFTCRSDKFISELNSRDFSTLDSAIGALNEVELDSNCNSDVNNSLRYYQCIESDYNYLTRVLKSYKKDSVIGHGFNRTIIRDLDKYDPKIEYGVHPNASLRAGNSKLFKLSNEPNYSGKHLLSKSYNNLHYIYNKDYENLIDNFLYNSRYYSDSQLGTPIPISRLTQEGIGDYVKMNSESIKYKKSIIYSRIIDISGNTLSTNLYIKSYE
jgi:hypothetical protein